MFQSNTSAFNAYLRQIADFPLLGDEEKECFVRFRNGETSLRNRIIEANLRLVVSIVNEFPRIEAHRREDLVFAGNVGLMEAVDKFDPSYGTKFCTFARTYILARVRRQLVTMHGEGIIRPGIANDVAMKIKKYREEVNPNPTLDELCSHIGVGEGVIRALFDGWHFRSINDRGDSESREFGDTIPSPQDSPAEVCTAEASAEELKRILSKVLLPDERRLVLSYYGFKGKKKTLKMLGEERGLSIERVRQLIVHALWKLRREIVSDAEKPIFCEEQVEKNS